MVLYSEYIIAFQNGNVKRPPIKNKLKPRYLNKTATNIHTMISIKYILRALKFKEIASNILLFVKNINGATNTVTATQTMANRIVGTVSL